ncbi:MAG: helix-turn-helix domain-containing protein [Candidatus Paceibacterota bacterium]
MARKSSNPKDRSKRFKAKVLEHLKDSGNISYACKRAGISRETYYKWRRSKVFREEADRALELGKEFVNDLAHTQLIQNIQQGHVGAVKFQLASCHPDYQPRKPWPRELPDKEPLPVTEIHIHPAPLRDTLDKRVRRTDDT